MEEREGSLDLFRSFVRWNTVPFSRVHEETVLDCGVIRRKVFEEEDGGADIGWVRSGEKLEVCIISACAALVIGIGFFVV